MFHTKKCPNCNMKIRTKNESFIICPYCDTEYRLLSDGSLAHRHVRSRDDANHSDKQKHSDIPNLSGKPKYSDISKHSGSVPSKDDRIKPKFPKRNFFPKSNPEKTYGFSGYKNRNSHDKMRQGSLRQASVWPYHRSVPNKSENRRQLEAMLRGLGVILTLVIMARSIFSLTTKKSTVSDDYSEFRREITENPSMETLVDVENLIGELGNSTFGEYVDDVQNALPSDPIVRTVPESPFMIRFSESVFHRPIEEVNAEDYKRITGFRIRHLDPLFALESENDYAEYAVDYILDGQELTHCFDITAPEYESLDYEDFTVFPNLEILDLGYDIDIFSPVSILRGTLDVRSLKHLHTLIPQNDITLNEVVEAVADPSKIRTLGFSLDATEDLNLLTEVFPELEQLVIIDFSKNKQDFSPIGELKQLKHLSTFVQENNDYLKSLPALENLELKYYHYDPDLRFLNDLHSLKMLSLNMVAFYSTDAFSFLPGLEEIRLTNVFLDDYSTLAELGNIKRLRIEGITMEGLPGIDRLTDLEELYLYDSNSLYFENMPTLVGLTNLKKLTLPYHYYNAVGELPELTELSLYYTEPIMETDTGSSSIKHFSNTPNLETLSVHGHMDVEAMNHIDELHNLKSFTLAGIHAEQFPMDAFLKATKLERLRIVSCFGDLVLNDSSLRNESLTEFNLNYSMVHPNVTDTGLHTNSGFHADFFQTMPNLKDVEINDLILGNIDFIEFLPKLEMLNLSKSDIRQPSLVDNHPSLKTLYYYSPDGDVEFRDGLEAVNLYY